MGTATVTRHRHHKTIVTMHAPDAFEHLIAALPPFAREECLRRTRYLSTLPRTAGELLDLVRGWASGAGIAEGRGGYPGGTTAPGWAEYVREQQRNIAVHRAITEVFGEAGGRWTEILEDYERTFGLDVRLLGDEHGAHVDEMAGRLIYSVPSKAGFDRETFSCAIRQEDLGVLRADPYRRAVLEVALRETLERSTIPDGKPVTEMDFAHLVSRILHPTPAELQHFVALFDREYGVDIDASARQAMAGRAAH